MGNTLPSDRQSLAVEPELSAAASRTLCALTEQRITDRGEAVRALSRWANRPRLNAADLAAVLGYFPTARRGVA